MKYPILTPDAVRKCVEKLPRVDLAHLPTPFEEVPRFAERLGGVRIYLKRDDCTGLLFGGNKTRHNEFLLAEALRQGADVVVWGAGVQSNNCRQTAAACAKLGLECRLYLTRASHDDAVQGNLLLDHLVGAKVEIVDLPMGPEMNDLLAAKAEELRAAGRQPFFWEPKSVRPIAAVGYVLCMAEIADDIREHRLHPSAIYISSAGGTGAGMALGRAVLGLSCPVRNICPIKWPWKVREDLAEVANQTAALLNLPHRLTAGDIEASEEYIGSAYGAVTNEGWEAMDLLARTEGILLDPVYTAKAMAALIHDIRSQRIKAGETAIFVHTGGIPAVFAYRDELMERHAHR
jgi:1-aminocyclopropane-1-carboxylate deaminase/D-cysteine desulfhydrase-like pyridoxal-dependent ACC family enzyme